MNEMTIFLAQITGPILLAIGLGIFMARQYYAKVYRDIEKETLAMLGMSIGLIAVGIVWIGRHNIWDSAPAIIISLIGWGSLFKGFVMALFPGWVDSMGNMAAKSNGLINSAGFVAIAIGIYLSWIGFFA